MRRRDWRHGPFALLQLYNLKTDRGRGFVQLDASIWEFAASKSARLHFQLTRGFGETLLDYNHRQTTIGLGVSFTGW